MTLVDLKPDIVATIIEIRGNEESIGRLKALGIYENATIEKRCNVHKNGPVFVSTQHKCNFALGHNLATCIIVSTQTA